MSSMDHLDDKDLRLSTRLELFKEHSVSTNKESRHMRSMNVIHFVAYLLTEGI